VECISAAGRFIPSRVVIQGKVALEGRALGQKVKFITLKLPSYNLQSFAHGNWQEGIDISGDEFEDQCDFIPL
jgi:hypothetical protein